MQKKVILLSVICTLALGACSDKKEDVATKTTHPASVAIEETAKPASTQVTSTILDSSCHTCFDYQDNQSKEEAKMERSAQYRFVLQNTTIYSKDLKPIGTITKGFGGEEVSKIEDKVVLKVKGYQKEGDNQTLYIDEALNLPAISLDQPLNATEFEIVIPQKEITSHENDVWSKNEFAYYDNCSMCHAAHAPKVHSIQEWEAIYGTMKAFAMPTSQDDELIWQYLKAHAKDGFAASD